MKAILAGAFVALGIALAVVGMMAMDFLANGAGPSEETVAFEVPAGASFRSIAQRLQSEGLVSSAWKLRWYARLTGLGSQMRRGEYALKASFSPREILSIIASGKSIAYPLTIPEGFNKYDIAAEYEAKRFGRAADFLAAARDPELIRQLLGVERIASLEGYLYPETYMLTKFTTARELVSQMVKNFLAAYAEVSMGVSPALDRHQLVTLASVVEKETGAPHERPLIASVFYNRLKKGMRLQSDPTILYGIAEATGQMKENITRDDILRPTPYNTYTVKALPIGPIANPGRESLMAVLKPATSEYLYFVSHNDGTHAFTKTYEEHTAAVRKFQLDPRARAGHSWRELKHRNTNQ